MKTLFFEELTFKDEDEIPEDINRTIGLHIRCGSGILSHIPIEGAILHLDPTINVTYFISLLACSWLKKIRYLRIWQHDKEVCVIYSDKINIKTNCFTYLRLRDFIIKYHSKVSANKNIIFTDPPIEVREFFSSGLKPNRLILATPDYLASIATYNKSICYRNCIVTSIWILYFIASNSRRKIMEDGILRYKWNKIWYTLTDILKHIYIKITNMQQLRYLTDDESKYVDSIYLECLSIDILSLGRLCKAHP